MPDIRSKEGRGYVNNILKRKQNEQSVYSSITTGFGGTKPPLMPASKAAMDPSAARTFKKKNNSLMMADTKDWNVSRNKSSMAASHRIEPG
jgi:hypothetical protein